MLQISGFGTVAFIVFVGLFALLTVGLLFGVLFALLSFNKKFEEFTKKADPVITQATDTLEQVQRVTATIGERADNILSRGEKMTESVSSNVEKTANVVHNTVTKPLISLSSMLSGLTKGFSVWGHSATSGEKADHNNNGRS